MSNVPNVDPSAAPAAPSTPTPATAAPGTPADFEAAYRAEVAAHIASREKYKNAERLLADLSPEARAELLHLGELARAGDPAAIQQWALETADSLAELTGSDVAAMVAARQKGAEGAPVVDPTKIEPGMTAAEIAELVRQTSAQVIAERDAAAAGQAKVVAELEGLGYKLGSAAGKTIITHAVDNDTDLATAVAWYENDTATSKLEKDRAAAAAAATVPGAAPQGVPVGTLPDDATPREKAEWRLKRSATN